MKKIRKVLHKNTETRTNVSVEPEVLVYRSDQFSECVEMSSDSSASTAKPISGATTSASTTSTVSSSSVSAATSTTAPTTATGTSTSNAVSSASSGPATTTALPFSPPTSGRKKKRVTDLQCFEIRWFIRKENDSKWSALCGYDSLVIEVAWRLKNNVAIDEATRETLLDQIPKTESVIVLDGLYMLDEKSENLESVYWKGESIPIRRGSWFQTDSMQPLPMDLADTIEKHHLTSFREQSIPEGPVFSDTESSKRPVLTTINWNELDEIRWNSVIDIVWYNNSKTNRLLRFVTRSKGTVLRRGYNEDANVMDGRPNFSDLVLVVHGIGQKGYENLIAKNTGQMRDVIIQLMEKNYSHENRRPMMLPIEWRASLVLDDGLTDTITLPRMPSMRNTLNAVAMDIMYYQSPLYRSEIVNGVIRTMNNTYSMFMKNNPGFNGRVSIVAHSLGSVITYDILSNWSPLVLYDEFVTNAIKEHMEQAGISEEEKAVLENFHSSRKKIFEDEQKAQGILLRQEEPLQFKVENLFAIGSPLAVFLVMRGNDYTSIFPKNGSVRHIYNIFHPYDPVAYRLEPLYDAKYKHVRPVKLFYYGDERARKSYNNLPYELHKSYLRRLKKQQKKEDKEAKGDKNGANKEEEDESDSGDDDLSVGSSPRSCSPVPQDEQDRSPPELPPPPTTQSRHWWKFGGTTATVAPTPEENSIEVAKEASSGGSACSTSPVPTESKTDKDKTNASKPLTQVEALIDEIPFDRRLQTNVKGQVQRLDFFLQPALTEKSYWSVLKSHFAYWQSYDFIAFMLNVLYPQPQAAEQPLHASASQARL